MQHTISISVLLSFYCGLFWSADRTENTYSHYFTLMRYEIILYIYKYTPLQVSCFCILFLLMGNPLLNFKTMPNVHLCACNVFCIKWLIIYYFLCMVPRTCNGFAFAIATIFSLFYTIVNRHCRLRRCERIIKCWIRDGKNRVVIVLVGKEKVKNGIFFQKI